MCSVVYFLEVIVYEYEYEYEYEYVCGSLCVFVGEIFR